MFEDYIQDANEFYSLATRASEMGQEREARRYYRVSVFCAASAMESFVNYLADTFTKGGTLNSYELAFLSDKVLLFSSQKIELVEKKEFHRLEEKLHVLIKRFPSDHNIKENSAWSKFLDFKNLRDRLTHPKQAEDETPLSEYKTKIRGGIQGIIEIMNHLSMAIFKRPLRKQILDMSPD